jgi:hypothetical protein
MHQVNAARKRPGAPCRVSFSDKKITLPYSVFLTQKNRLPQKNFYTTILAEKHFVSRRYPLLPCSSVIWRLLKYLCCYGM